MPGPTTKSSFDRSFDPGRFEAEVQQIGRELLARAAGTTQAPRLYRGAGGWLLRGVMHDTALRNALFRFVDVLPQLVTPADVAGHLRAYLDDSRLAGLQPLLLRLAARPGLAGLVQRALRQMARQFMAEEDSDGVAGLDRVRAALSRVPAAMTVDAVGEAVLSETEAASYLRRNLALIEHMALHGDAHLSLKLTALTPRFDPIDPAGTQRRVLERIAPLMAAAIRHRAALTVDMEHRELKPLILDLFLALCEAWPDPAWRPGIALQAYLPETGADLDRVLAAGQRLGRRLGVRLVKGAYWDQEAAWATQRGWPCPTFAHKAETDANYEALSRRLLENTDTLFPAIASHNPRSQAVALCHARRLELAPTQWEAQMLHGMAEPLRDALAGAGVRLRIYVPTGDAVSGIAYLIRRLLENTASTSVLRLAYVEGEDIPTLLAPPQSPAPAQKAAKPTAGNDFRNTPLLDFSRVEARTDFAAALLAVRQSLPRVHLIEGAAAGLYTARNPAAPDEILGEIQLGDAAHAGRLLQAALAAFPAWRDTPAGERIACLRRAADLMAARRHELAALMVLEAAKNWREADADVAEAIDFLRYYAGQMEALSGWRETERLPGERNLMRYEPRGISLVIAPWNFPLAILAGMASAALVAGNCAILKPAQPGLLVGHAFRRLLVEAGVPPAVCPLLAAEGRVAGALAGDPRLALIAFTGSREVGLSLLETAHRCVPGQRLVKQVVCEMGGKNAIVVDADADLDEAVSGILASAFGYAGQKCSACSRVIAVGGVHERLLERLIAAADALAWGPPEDPACLYGPVISVTAQRKALDYLAIGQSEGRCVWQGRVPQQGWYAPPAIFAGILPQHRLAREEIFAPVLAVLHAPDFATALDWALDGDYALTGGVYSRFPAHLELAQRRFRVGDLYLNRRITGARVSVQPFGGVALSGTGVQAGGPDYLRQFLCSRVVSSNESRHGYIGEAS